MYQRTVASFVAAVSGFVLLTACADRPRVAKAAEGPDLGAPDVAWDQKTHEERTAYMGAFVEPTMKRLFVEYDPHNFGDFSCTTCHGKDLDVIDFSMPNDIYALPADNPIGEAMDLDPKIAQFMMGKVVPTMAKLLHEPSGPGGVTCFTCHPKEG
jgi:hypothetical protein